MPHAPPAPPAARAGARRRPRGALDPATLRQALAALPRVRTYWVAYSGGPDSHVLLHALAAPGQGPGGAALRAAHVHHGLHPEADAWAAHCREVCQALGVELQILRVEARPQPGESPEEAARRARYGALGALAEAGTMVLTAHHERDQAETLLVQLLRGAGPHGLAAMPACARLGGGWLGRPLLGVSAAAIRAYHEAHRLRSVQDPSNREPRYARGFVRAEVLPRLRARDSGVDRTLARAAARQAEVARLLDAQARSDLAPARIPQSGALRGAALAALPEDRARNALRLWLRELGLGVPGHAQLERVLKDVLGARSDRAPVVRWGGVEVRRHRGVLHAMPALAAPDPERVWRWRPPAPLALPWGRLEAVAARGRGLDAERCAREGVEVRFRRGGERCRPAPGARTRTLKNLFQEHGVPPWQRERLPLVYVGGQLAAVAGWWVCAPARAGPGRPGWLLRWEWRAEAG